VDWDAVFGSYPDRAAKWPVIWLHAPAQIGHWNMGLTNVAIPSTPHHFYPPAGSCAGKKKTRRLSHVPGLLLDLQQTPFGFYFLYLHNPDQSVADRYLLHDR